MALGSNEVFSTQTRGAFPRLEALSTKVVHLEDNAGSAPVSLVIGVPLAFDESTEQYCVWEKSGSNSRDVIRGFVYGEAQKDDNTDDTLVVMLLRGRVHRDDVNTAAILLLCGGSPAAADLDDALREGSPSLRELGIDVVGLTEIR